MNGLIKIMVIFSLALLPVSGTFAQPVWVTGTPSVASTDAWSITVNYGLDREGTVYVIVFNFNNTAVLTSSYVRTRALSSPSGTVVATAVLSVRKGDAGKTLKAVLNVSNPNQIHTIYIVAADNRGRLQSSPVRLNATTLPCPESNAGSGGNICGLSFILNAVPVFKQASGPKSQDPARTFSL
jgi:hypothetical protein